jgi:hypothetical protein
VVDKYHCIPIDGRAAFVVQVNVCSLLETTSNGFVSVDVDTSVTDDIGTNKKCYQYCTAVNIEERRWLDLLTGRL